MNPTNKKSPQTRGISQPLNRQSRGATQLKPLAAEPKSGVAALSVRTPTAASASKRQLQQKVPQAGTAVAPAKTPESPQSVKRPIAPPAFRPQWKPVSVQAKVTGSPELKNQPVAPLVYQAQSTPKILQTKKIADPQGDGGRRQMGPALSRVAQARMPVKGRLTAPAPKTTPGAFVRPVNAIQRAAAAVAAVYGPVNLIEWDDLVAAGRDHGLVTRDLDDGSQLLGPNGMAYPHFHRWSSGKVAFSYGHNKNYKVGNNEKLDLDTLRDELSRYVGQKIGAVFDFVQWLYMVSN